MVFGFLRRRHQVSNQIYLWFVVGIWVADGQRTDIEEYAGAIKNGSTDGDLLDSFPTQLVRYPKAVPLIRSIQRSRTLADHHNVECRWIWGPTGTGKTSAAKEWLRLNVGQFYTQTASTFGKSGGWWDSYDGERGLLIDELNTPPFIDINTLLGITDKYRFRAQVKGGGVMCFFTHIAITSNNHPSCIEWGDNKQLAPLYRRIPRVIKLVPPPEELPQEEPEEIECCAFDPDFDVKNI